MNEPIHLHVSIDSKEEAERISNFLLEEKLVVCVQISKIHSKYWWKGKIEKAEEYLVIAKTFSDKFHDIVEELKKHHTYEIPEIIALPIKYASDEYIEWMRESIY
ncbi:MAG: divalent-cation tolerance protein CutA [Candidatus Heimdallarchaeum aukensis]|uniref:Divalent-cation tolerance protein CutA n=1 Tax=Candidatus Heimdallarchaeum aukensis TaxID=2876573 RepID=A0A9Y1BM25_9ARCH|nr:MAG: divalent-cation tolerance protein CutA [Candidatus Heimdallarchaeum aukensis]